jgi:hypothetical protein
MRDGGLLKSLANRLQSGKIVLLQTRFDQFGLDICRNIVERGRAGNDRLIAACVRIFESRGRIFDVVVYDRRQFGSIDSLERFVASVFVNIHVGHFLLSLIEKLIAFFIRR